MTDKNLASLPPIELIGMLNISRARFARSKDNNERARLFEQQIEIVRALSVAFEGRKRVTSDYVDAIASRLVNYLETYDLDAMESFNDSLIGGWEFDYSAHVGEALDRLADARILTR